MSEEMARKKKEEIEGFQKVEQAVLQEVAEDRCPACGLETSKVEFFNEMIIKTFGWIECTRCGNVYTPKSILKQKRAIARSGLIPSVKTETPPLIVPSN